MKCGTLGANVTEECELWNVGSEVQSKELEVKSIKCDVLSEECEV